MAEVAGRIEPAEESDRFRLLAGPYDSPGIARAAAERIGELLNIRSFAVWRTNP